MTQPGTPSEPLAEPIEESLPEEVTVEVAEEVAEAVAGELAEELAGAGETRRPSPAALAEPPPATVTTTRRRRVGGLIQSVGRRKEAVVRVRLSAGGAGTIVCNGRPLADYFPSRVHQQLIRSPLVVTERGESVDIAANLRGGGTTGQAGALRLAIARALCELDGEHRPALKKAGFLTRNARVIERKKYGLKKARKAPQYSKR